jgi:large subunit ribosomal protein L19
MSMTETAQNTTQVASKLPAFKAGDTVKVHYKIIEGDKSRIQPYEGIVISKKGEGMSKTFTVRKIGADTVGVERIFPLFSPNIDKLEVTKVGRVRRAKLYFLRGKKGKAATKIKEETGEIAVE